MTLKDWMAAVVLGHAIAERRERVGRQIADLRRVSPGREGMIIVDTDGARWAA